MVFSRPPSYLTTNRRGQRRAQRLVNDKRPHLDPDSFQPLQERRDVAVLCAMHKGKINLHTPHLGKPSSSLRPPPPPSLHPCRPTQTGQVSRALSRIEHHLRSFLPRYGPVYGTS
ncbi:hypothetical protein GWK47_009048 [Chionoecetes opilio]|uniref:Uncharacterized protein n=1 Tax=Chionoecetes opilio TaxID=41210 RepID=A0A8J4Y5N8_CHIOP|nr:hypothetical protein GWK47_009048 [Chionoecetes opilio]